MTPGDVVTDKLLPCPFCGSDDVHYDDNTLAHYGLDYPGVECMFCSTRNFASTKEEAIKNWNRRIS